MAADDDHRLGQLGECQCLPRRDDVFAVDGHERHLARSGARGEDDVIGLVLRTVHVYPAVAFETAETLYEVDVVLFQQKGHAFAHGFGDAARTGDDLLQIGPHLTGELQSVVGRILAVGVDLCALQERLGRDAAPVEADAARFGTFDDGGLFA